MGRCGACFSGATRMVLYAVVLVSTAATLWGLVSSQTKNSSCWLGGSTCILFGHVSANTSRCGVSQLHIATGGAAASCHFVVYFGAAQLLTIAALFSLSIVVACKRQEGHSDDTWRRVARFVEMVVISLLVLCSLAAALIISIGLISFCGQLSKYWRADPSNLAYNAAASGHADEKLTSCSSMYLQQDVAVSFNATGKLQYASSYSKVQFHHYFYVAQIAAWVSFLVWAAHLVVSVAAYRRKPLSEELPYTLRPSDSLSSVDDDLLI